MMILEEREKEGAHGSDGFVALAKSLEPASELWVNLRTEFANALVFVSLYAWLWW